ELEERGYRVFEVSAVSREGLRQLSFALAELVEADRRAKADAPPPPRIVLRPRPVDEAQFEVSLEGGTEPVYRVRGAKAGGGVAQTAFTNGEAIAYLGDRLARLGVAEALVAAGAVPGCAVEIGGVVVDWEPTLTPAAELISSLR